MRQRPRDPLTYDAVVVGSGPNGLVAANVLADAGRSVVVLEQATEPGGSVRSADLAEPGFLADTCSAFYPLAAASPAISGLDLESHGLEWLHAPLVLAHPAEDGTCPVVSRDLDETVVSLDSTFPGDGDAWRQLYARWSGVQPHLVDALFTPFPPVRAAFALATKLGVADLVRLARFLLLPVRRMAEEGLGGEPARRLLAAAALHADLAPEMTLSGFYGWLLCMLGQSVGFPVPRGGARALTAALVRRLEHAGGELRCGADVDAVLVEAGRASGVVTADGDRYLARRAVIADVDVQALYTGMLPDSALPREVRSDIDRFHREPGTFKVDWSLDGPIPWSAPDARRAGTVHVAESVDELTMQSAEIACGTIPRHPFLVMGQQSMIDPGRQPAGRETAWAYTHVPATPKGDASGELAPRWDADTVSGFVDRIEARIEVLAPGFRRLVRRRHVLTPADFEAHNPNLVGGGVSGGTAQLHQQLVFRPVPGTGRPSTPVAGLYLGSASAHPGGGVHGAAGSNAARAALMHDRVPLTAGAARLLRRLSVPR